MFNSRTFLAAMSLLSIGIGQVGAAASDDWIYKQFQERFVRCRGETNPNSRRICFEKTNETLRSPSTEMILLHRKDATKAIYDLRTEVDLAAKKSDAKEYNESVEKALVNNALKKQLAKPVSDTPNIKTLEASRQAVQKQSVANQVPPPSALKQSSVVTPPSAPRPAEKIPVTPLVTGPMPGDDVYSTMWNDLRDCTSAGTDEASGTCAQNKLKSWSKNLERYPQQKAKIDRLTETLREWKLGKTKTPLKKFIRDTLDKYPPAPEAPTQPKAQITSLSQIYVTAPPKAVAPPAPPAPAVRSASDDRACEDEKSVETERFEIIREMFSLLQDPRECDPKTNQCRPFDEEAFYRAKGGVWMIDELLKQLATNTKNPFAQNVRGTRSEARLKFFQDSSKELRNNWFYFEKDFAKPSTASRGKTPREKAEMAANDFQVTIPRILKEDSECHWTVTPRRASAPVVRAR